MPQVAGLAGVAVAAGMLMASHGRDSLLDTLAAPAMRRPILHALWRAVGALPGSASTCMHAPVDVRVRVAVCVLGCMYACVCMCMYV